MTAPLHTRSNSSLIGGVFFLGEASGQFNDTYIFGNSANGFIYGMRITNGVIADQPVQIATATNVSSFGTDNRGRILAARVGNSGAQNSITANTGTVVVLNSPDMIISPAVALRHTARGGAPYVKPITRGELLRNRDHYEIKTLNGRSLTSIPSGAFLVSKKGSPVSPQLMSPVWE